MNINMLTCSIRVCRLSLLELEKGIKGLVVMSSSLEEIFHNIHDARVPPLWEKVREDIYTIHSKVEWKCTYTVYLGLSSLHRIHAMLIIWPKQVILVISEGNICSL